MTVIAILLTLQLLVAEGFVSKSIRNELVQNCISRPNNNIAIHQYASNGDDIESVYYDKEDENLFLSIAKKNKDELNKTKPPPADYIYNPCDGAGIPRASLKPEEVGPLLMNALKNNDIPRVNSGLESVWEFSVDTTKYVFKNNMTDFIESCHETANEFATSFYGVAMKGISWEMESDINMVGGENGWIATQVMKTISSDGRMRRWQWEFRKNRRPPCLGCWKVESIASSDRQGNFQTEGRGTGWED
mmetsp:Transcript_275/g.371  ORF Transcript_275/g.371 Transcript_275/m.371 type:complete len:247 (+) Transcript_275:143-883(+)